MSKVFCFITMTIGNKKTLRNRGSSVRQSMRALVVVCLASHYLVKQNGFVMFVVKVLHPFPKTSYY